MALKIPKAELSRIGTALNEYIGVRFPFDTIVDWYEMAENVDQLLDSIKEVGGEVQPRKKIDQYIKENLKRKKLARGSLQD